ncbi:peptidoglycan-binding domain-containing protein [Thomasclavelia saccharogumia]|nr:peptidoglycan-binding domain-containing protein [Thomasclavelia saccharogumia]
MTRLIQERLNSVGFSLTVDGIFGTNMYNAIKVF